MNESWGVEFIDDGNYGKPISLSNLKQPWKDTHPHAIEVTAAFLLRLVDPVRLATIRHADTELIDVLREDIWANGLLRPLEVVYDGAGTIRFEDGHHRLEVLQRLPGYSMIPIVLVRSSGKIKAKGFSFTSHLPDLIKLLDQNNYPL